MRARALILFPVRPGVIYDSRAPASRRMGTGHGHCDAPCTRFSKNIKSNMHETVTGAGQQLFSPRSLCLCTLFSLSCLRKKKKKHLEEDCVSLVLGELKVEATALQKQELSWCFAYIIALKQISVCNTTTYKRRASCRSNYGGLA